MKKYEGYALITGGSEGIGLEFAHELAAREYNLVLVARDLKKLKNAEQLLKKKYPVEVITIAQDLSKPESTDNIYNILQEKKIHIGILVNNAGFNNISQFLDIDRNYHLDMIRTLCLSITDLTYKFMPPMLQKRSGGIIFVSSAAGLVSVTPMNAVYGASKSFCVKLGVGLHAEYASKGIDILTVCPGPVDTEIHIHGGLEHPKGEKLLAQEVASQSLDKLGKEIVLPVSKNRMINLAIKLSGFLPYALAERLVKRYVKKNWDIDL